MAITAEVLKTPHTFYSLRIKEFHKSPINHPERRPDTPAEITIVNAHGFEFRRTVRRSGFIDYERGY